MNQLVWGNTQTGQPLVILNGHELTKKLDTKITTNWKCGMWRSHSCKVTLITCGDSVLNLKNELNDEITPGNPKHDR